MTLAERVAMIDSSPETGEYRAITYDDKRDIFPVKKIPLKALLYNPYNGRIGSLTKSFLKQDFVKNEDVVQNANLIEQYLFDSSANRNEKTMASLSEKGQQDPGIVTKDGIIIDGNRRAMLLNILSKQSKQDGYFNAIVLPDTLFENEKNIVALETMYQMGVDSKVDYNPIEKYLRCKDLLFVHEMTLTQISELMAEPEKRIREWLSILELMDEYLDYLHQNGKYILLSKREGHFVDLRNYLKSYSEKRHPSVGWDYTDSDVQDLKTVYFDYIRLGTPVLRTRIIAKTSTSNSIFSTKTVWDEFYKEHLSIKYTVSANLEGQKEDVWQSYAEEPMYKNLSFYETVLKDISEKYLPIKILKKILNSISQISLEDLSKTDGDEELKVANQIHDRLNNIVATLSKD
jgi:hypothetical protein